MKNFLTNRLTLLIISKILLLLIAVLFVHFNLTIGELETQIDQLQTAVIHHSDNHPHLLQGYSPGCADAWAEFWSWLSNNSCAGGSR